MRLNYLIKFINFTDTLNDWVGKIFGLLVYPTMLVLVY